MSNVESSSLSTHEKLSAVTSECKIKQNALRDTIAENETLQRKIIELHRQDETIRDEVRAAHVDLEESKKRHTLQRYYRSRAEEQHQDRQQLLASLVAAQSRRSGLPESQGDLKDRISPRALDETRIIVSDIVNRSQSLRRKRDALALSVSDVVAMRAKLESAVQRQLSHTEVLADSLASTKGEVAHAIVQTANDNTATRNLRRQVADLEQRCAKLDSELRDQLRRTDRMSARLRNYDGKVGSLQGARSEAKTHVEIEASHAAARDEEVQRLRRENVELIEWLLEDTPNFISEEEMEVVRSQAQAKQAAGFVVPPHDPGIAIRKAPDTREERLFKELHHAIESTAKVFGSTH